MSAMSIYVFTEPLSQGRELAYFKYLRGWAQICYAEDCNAEGLVQDYGPHYSDDTDGKKHAAAIRAAENVIVMYWERKRKREEIDNYPM